MSNQVVFLKGKKTILRPAHRSDAPLLTQWINDPEVRQYLASIYPQTEEDEIGWIDGLSKKKPRELIFVITLHDGTPIGVMGVHNINGVHGTATTGALIGDKQYWGQGYGSDAKMVLLEYAFNTLNVRKLYSDVIAFNERSVAYSLKCGYVEEARLKEHYYRLGRYWDQVILSVTRERFLPVWQKYQGE